MKLISWNVNGIRACLNKGFLDFFNEEKADIFCIQETKMLAGDDPILSKVAEFMKNYSNQYSNLMYINEQEEQEKVYNTDMALAAETGENKGRIEGRVEGRLEEKQKMVENLLNFGDSIEKISAVSGLSVDEVLKIKNSLEK